MHNLANLLYTNELKPIDFYRNRNKILRHLLKLIKVNLFDKCFIFYFYPTCARLLVATKVC